MQLSKEERKGMQKKGPKMVVCCKLKVPSLRLLFGITRQASRCWTVTVVTEFSIRSSQPLKVLIIKFMCNARTFVTHEYEMFLLHTYVTYENVIWPNLCNTQKYELLFYIWKCVMSFSVLLFSEFGQMHIEMFQKLRGSDSLVFKIWTSA